MNFLFDILVITSKKEINLSVMKYILFFLILMHSIFLEAQTDFVVEASARIVVGPFDPANDTIINAGVIVSLEKDWHIYWRNSGDSGIPTSFEFILPENIKVSDIKWAVPKIFEFEGYASYGYEGIAVFPFNIIIPENFNQDEITIEVNLKSLICKDVCKPFNEKIRTTIRLDEIYIPMKPDFDLLFWTSKNIPVKNDILKLQAKNYSDSILINISSERIKINKINNVHFIPYENGIFKNSVEQNFTVSGSNIVLAVEFDPFKTKIPDTLNGILIIDLISEEGNSKLAFEVNEKIE